MARKTAIMALLPTLLLSLGAAPYGASRWNVQSKADPEVGPNGYIVEFPPALGGMLVEMPVETGDYKVEFDTRRGESKVTRWDQRVGAIELLGMSTGPITITLEQAQPLRPGKYDPNGGPDKAGTFELNAVFKIEFDDTELRQIGLTSPVIMEAAEYGTIYRDGVMVLSTEGTSDLFDQPLTFQCITTTRLDQLQFSELNIQPD